MHHALRLSVCCLAASWGGLVCHCLPVMSAEPARPDMPLELVADLDDPQFAVRERAELKLIALGETALPALAEGAKSESAEVRIRVRRVLNQIRRRLIDVGFRGLSEQADDKFDVEQGCWLISRMLNPTCRREDLNAQLDKLAEQVRQRLGAEYGGARQGPARRRRGRPRTVLFDEAGFKGNTTEYRLPDNSSLERVLETRQDSLQQTSPGKIVFALEIDGRRGGRLPSKARDRGDSLPRRATSGPVDSR